MSRFVRYNLGARFFLDTLLAVGLLTIEMAERRNATPALWVGLISLITVLSFFKARGWIILRIPCACISFFCWAKMSLQAIIRIRYVVERKFSTPMRNASAAFAAVVDHVLDMVESLPDSAFSSVLEESTAIYSASNVFCWIVSA